MNKERAPFDTCNKKIPSKNSPTPWLYELYCPKCGKVITKYKSLCKSVRTAKNYYHNPCRVSLKARKIKK